MAQVSSVRLSVAPAPATAPLRDQVKKGDEIAFFQFGGSDIVVVFQQKAGLSTGDFIKTTSPGLDYTFYGQPLAYVKRAT
jgi:phosphatidylserine decarboxylase